MSRVIVIGCGGIGSHLIPGVARYLAFKAGSDTRLILVDGDYYEPRNAERQLFARLGNKARAQADELSLYFPQLNVEANEAFVGTTTGEKNGSKVVGVAELIENGDWVLMGVDNHATRKLVSDHVRTLDEVTLISGGNDLDDGNAQIYLRRGGKDVTPSLDAYHPEIAEPKDRSPHELSCEERAMMPGSEQLVFTNALIAAIMGAIFHNLYTKQEQDAEVYFDLNAVRDSVRGVAVIPVVRSVIPTVTKENNNGTA